MPITKINVVPQNHDEEMGEQEGKEEKYFCKGCCNNILEYWMDNPLRLLTIFLLIILVISITISSL